MKQRELGRQDGKGGERRGKVVSPPEQGVWLAIGDPFAIGNDVVVGREGCCPPSVPAGGSASCGKILCLEKHTQIRPP